VTRARLIGRLRREEGQSLIELLAAMAILSFALLALFAGFSSGYVAMKRATRVSSATLLADSQMERFRAVQFGNIVLNQSAACGSTCTEDSTYTADTAYSSAAQVSSTSSTCMDATCIPTQTQTGADGKTYRVDTYIAWSCATGTLSTSPSISCSSGLNPVKLVTIVVRKNSGGTWVREQSLFNSLIGS
jgi:type II secretory pathway pseudopilin PulG